MDYLVAAIFSPPKVEILLMEYASNELSAKDINNIFLGETNNSDSIAIY